MDENMMNAPVDVIENHGDDDLMDFDAIVATAAASAPDTDVVAPALNQSVEFMRKFAENFSTIFALEVPNTPIVNQALEDAKVESKKKLEARVARENKRRKELAIKFLELQKNR